MMGSVGVGWAITVGSAVIGVVPSCNVTDSGKVVVTYGSHYLVDEFVAWEFDPMHGDRVDVVMVSGPEIQERCDHYGGVLAWHDPDAVDELGLAGRYVCTEVDF